ncbi:MAG TPA: hypothetical protein VIG68_02175, partial [Lysobacter sp.]
MSPKPTPPKPSTSKRGAKASSAQSAPAKQIVERVDEPTAPARESVSLEPIVAAVRKRLPKGAHAEGEAFVRAFYQRMSSDELPQHSAEAWAALAADYMEFVRSRKRGVAKVRLFNPSVGTYGWESPHTVLQIVNDDMPFL